MSMAVIGLIAGMALGFAGYFGGFGAFLLVAALGAVGFVAGRFLDGDLELGDFFRAATTAAATRGAGPVRGGRCVRPVREAGRPASRRARGDPDRRPGGGEDRAQAAREAWRPAAGRRAADATVVVRHEDGASRVSLGLSYPSDIGRQCGRASSVAERVGKTGGHGSAGGGGAVERLHPAQRGATCARGGATARPDERTAGGTRRLPVIEGRRHGRPAADGGRTTGPGGADASWTSRRPAPPTTPPGRGGEDGGRAASGPRAGFPRASSRSWCSRARASPVRRRRGAGRPARHAVAPRRPGSSREPSPRRHLGPGRRRRWPASASGCSSSRSPRAACLPAHAARPRRCTGRARPDRRRARPARPGRGGGRRAVRAGADEPARAASARSRTSVNSTTSGPTWTPPVRRHPGAGPGPAARPLGARAPAGGRGEHGFGPSTGCCSAWQG